MLNLALDTYRRSRVKWRQLLGVEPYVPLDGRTKIEYHGNKGYGGWGVPVGALNATSVVVDAGLGEDISFSESLIARYGCTIHGFDPTPRAADYVRRRRPARFVLHEEGLAGSTREATLFLPNEQTHVSGSIAKAEHLGDREIPVRLLSLNDAMKSIRVDHIDLLKVDIEGAEYELLSSSEFGLAAGCVHVLCIEFHHRWKVFGRESTDIALRRLRALGYKCVWRSAATNEEFTFALA